MDFDFENNAAENQPQNKPAPAVSQTNSFAIAGFICSFFIAILGLIFSIIGLSSAKKMNDSGKGFAVAGIVLSIIGLVITFIYVFLFVIVLAAISSY